MEELTQRLAPPLRSIVRKLIQRKPQERYQTAAELAADLRAGLGDSYGPKQALEEIYCSLDGARRSRRVVGPTNEGALPPVFVTNDDITTAPGGTD